MDATTDTAPGSDGSAMDAGSDACAVTPAISPGVDCFVGGRCQFQLQQCCFALTGAGFEGECLDAGTTCPMNFPTPWMCDKPGDCPTSAPACCASAAAGEFLLGNLLPGCPRQIAVPDAGDDAGPPPYVAQCQSSCSGQPQLCVTSKDCQNGGSCTAVQFPTTNKVMGVCL